VTYLKEGVKRKRDSMTILVEKEEVL
jgi:hypothetical protein